MDDAASENKTTKLEEKLEEGSVVSTHDKTEDGSKNTKMTKEDRIAKVAQVIRILRFPYFWF